ncbi:hypothetical protein [Sulfurisphaera ohwakuensis]|uniref:Putative OB-fold protein n=1 Tax=Sulfurisphaera ohwakuensis TaxID=69656 RepID=A0A650CKC4_SULOH|nr:hypothetical protein [Sulfurisphaera ohwakuensis]MBB5253683.1 putative OB-fold protein [Sulfurisphaera ohwakuensis]QGR18334.1 hypothetical protein D1869_14895 [Sulfurisphaera ohwakuensis]
MKCTKCGYMTLGRIKCPKCGGELTNVEEIEGKVLFSWILNVTPENLEEKYYLSLVETHNGKVLCKSLERYEGRVKVKNGECIKYV